MTVTDAGAHAPGLATAGPALSESRRRLETARLLSRARASQGERRRRYEDEVIRLNMRVAGEVARRYHGRGIASEDVDQVAYLGLVKAVRGFDPTRGDDFLSYAVPTLRGEIQRYFRDAGWAVRPPRSVQEVQAKVTRAEAELSQRLGRTPRSSEIAVHLDVPLTLVLDAQAASGCFFPASLDAVDGHRGDRRGADRAARRPRPGLRHGRGAAGAPAADARRSPSATAGSSSCGSSRGARRPRSARRSGSPRSRSPACSAGSCSSSAAASPPDPARRSGAAARPVR